MSLRRCIWGLGWNSCGRFNRQSRDWQGLGEALKGKLGLKLVSVHIKVTGGKGGTVLPKLITKAVVKKLVVAMSEFRAALLLMVFL